MTLARWTGRNWSPFRELQRLQNEMERVFGFAPARGRGGEIAISPDVDVFIREGNLIVKADLPGVKKEDVDVSLSENLLTIRASRKEEHETKEGEYHRYERSWGSFERTIELPHRVDSSKVDAKFTDGVLEITLPIHEEAKAKQISVKVE